MALLNQRAKLETFQVAQNYPLTILTLMGYHNPEISTSQHLLNIHNWDLLVDCTKELAGEDEASKRFRAPTLVGKGGIYLGTQAKRANGFAVKHGDKDLGRSAKQKSETYNRRVFFESAVWKWQNN